jgi:hypothetical protein
MTQSLTLLQKLELHFNAAAQKFPKGRELFEGQLLKCGEAFADPDYEAKGTAFGYPLFYKRLCYEVGKIEDSFEQGQEMVKVFWQAGDLIQEHKGPKF